MPHAEIKNDAGFGFQSLFVSDLNGAPLLVTLVQAVFSITDDAELVCVQEQPAVQLAGRWVGDPATTSLVLEPQIAFRKLGTDIVLHGFAYPPKPGDSRGQVGIRVGELRKVVNVFGDRRIYRTSGGASMTAPEPFDRIPLVYERCFGGWDRRHEDPGLHSCAAANPVGVGYYDRSLPVSDDLAVPNLEHPQHTYRGYGDAPPPAGFGFIAPNWQPRVAYAGTYDKVWNDSRKPLLPTDFDIRFFNAASQGLITGQPLRGDEEVVTIGATPEGRLAFHLPGLPPPVCTVVLRGSGAIPVQTALDTVVIDAEQRTALIMWRGFVPLRVGCHDVQSITVGPQETKLNALGLRASY
jgi:hypothetical protein